MSAPEDPGSSMGVTGCYNCRRTASHKAPNGRLFCASCASRLGLTDEHLLGLTPEVTSVRQTFYPKDLKPGVGVRHDDDDTAAAYYKERRPGYIQRSDDPTKFDECAPEFVKFVTDVNNVLQAKAKAKGYDADASGGKLMQDFLETYFGGHALGEVVMKAVRFRTKGDPEDLVKIAAWAYLVWSGNVVPLPPALRAAEQTATQAADEIMERLKPYEGVFEPVFEEAERRLAERPGVFRAGKLRLAALVAEEAGEALQAALDATRDDAGNVKYPLEVERMKQELVHTAAMALNALVVLKGRGV